MGYNPNGKKTWVNPKFDWHSTPKLFAFKVLTTTPKASREPWPSYYAAAVRNAISLGGDPDTVVCVTGGIAQVYYKEIPPDIVHGVKEKLARDLLSVVNRFYEKYNCEI